MFKHNFVISYRQMLRNKAYSIINICGLAMGMTVAILIGLWVNDEFTYNQYHDNYDSIVRVMRQSNEEDGVSTGSVLTTGMGTVLKESFVDQFEDVVMVRGRLETRVIANGDLKFTQNGYYMQDGAIQMFGLEMIHGNDDALKDIRSIMLSESLAQKLFEDENPVSQLIHFNGWIDLMVTGVYKDLPDNSTFSEASFIAPLNLYVGIKENALKIWNNYNMYVYAQLADNVEMDQVAPQITPTFEPYFADWARESGMTFFLQPMKDWHLYSEFEDGQLVTSKELQFVWLYTLIGVFVLILACINFMNLSTARSEKRAKEVGIRKTLGSLRRQLISQFYIESFLYSLLAFGLSLLLFNLALPWFNETSGKSIVAPWGEVNFWLMVVGFTLFTGFLAGSYPATYLSSFGPIKALKGSFKTGKSASIPRKVLVVFQFTISIALIIATITVNNQIEFAKNQPVGYSPEGMISIRPASPDFNEKLPTLINELKSTGYVQAVGSSNYPITNTRGWNGGFTWEGSEDNNNLSFNTISISHDYADAVGMEIFQGRNFSREMATDKSAVIINRSAMEKMGLTDPIGMTLTFDPEWQEASHYTIIGVAEDMIKGSPFEAPSQSIMFLDRFGASWLYIRMAPEASVSEAIAAMSEKFNEVLPIAPFDFQFSEVEYALKFQEEERVANLAAFFCLLAVSISCLGLFGLASYVAEQRTKEIGIRKVLGASINNLWRLLSKDFVLLVLISCIISIPIAYSVLDGWLQGYEIRTDLHWSIFAMAASLAFGITIATVSFQAIKAAVANPVKSLRTE